MVSSIFMCFLCEMKLAIGSGRRHQSARLIRRAQQARSVLLRGVIDCFLPSILPTVMPLVVNGHTVQCFMEHC